MLVFNKWKVGLGSGSGLFRLPGLDSGCSPLRRVPFFL